MKALHLFSNSRWTGPAEPAVRLCIALREQGVDTSLACCPGPPGRVNYVVDTARAHGIEPIPGFRLVKHLDPIKNWLDVRTLRRHLRENPPDVIHCHLDNDHRIATSAAAPLGIPVVRSNYHGAGLPKMWGLRRMLRHTRFLIQPSQRALEHDAAVHGVPKEGMTIVPGAVDTSRFDPARVLPDGRAQLDLTPDAFVVGIVARMQPHRHYENFWRAIRWLVDAHPHARAVAVGRGTKEEQVARQPVRELGLEDHVHFPGYASGDDYVAMLKALDCLVYLVPGSDGTCRAVREAMAMGVPGVVANRGMLPEIVAHEADGLVFDGSPEALFKALQQLAHDPSHRQRLGQNALQKAHTHYTLPAQATHVKAIYEQVMEG